MKAGCANLCLLFALMAVGKAESLFKQSVESPYQNGPQEISVLLPDSYDPQKQYRVVYILPVHDGQGSELRLFRKANLQNRFDVILADMQFEKEPWYGDHPTDLKIRQESYLRDFVVPFVEKKYSTLGTSEGRLLLGFSKSGWGAYSLILRNPDFFGYAAAWDAPFFFADFHAGMDEIFVTTDQLAKYRPDLLIPLQAAHFRDKTRFVLGGENKWGVQVPTPSGGSHTVEMHALLEKEGIKHIYRPDLRTKHTWSEAWIVPLFEELMKIAGVAEVARPATPSE